MRYVLRAVTSNSDIQALKQKLAVCRLCADRFAATATRHSPRPVVWFDEKPELLIAGQAPGLRVHEAQTPFWDRSGDRLRDWMGIGEADFYDRSRVAIVPMAFCFPGYDAAGSDLPPPPICHQTWHARIMAALGTVPLTLFVGGYAHRYHMSAKGSVTDTVRAWRDHAPQVFPLPHPSWRNTAWLKKNPWFAAELLPELRQAVKDALA
ncbi:MAG: uracil-DNA glycosylase family protein [Pseudomonadota bacterium]